MNIEHIASSELKPYEGNPRIHTDQQIEKLKASIEEYGIVLPVLIDTNNVIIAGHGVVQACNQLEISEIPCVRASHLTEAQVLERESKARQAKCKADIMEQEIREKQQHTEISQKIRERLTERIYDTQLIEEVVKIVIEVLGDSS